MTMPGGRARALRLADEILWEMVAMKIVPEDLRYQANAELRHYPDSEGLKQMISDIDRLPHKGPDQRWLAPEDAVRDQATGLVSGNGEIANEQ